MLSNGIASTVKMQKLTIAKTVHGYFLAPKHIAATGKQNDSETDEETDEDDFDFELGDENSSSSNSVSVGCKQLKKTRGM